MRDAVDDDHYGAVDADSDTCSDDKSDDYDVKVMMSIEMMMC